MKHYQLLYDSQWIEGDTESPDDLLPLVDNTSDQPITITDVYGAMRLIPNRVTCVCVYDMSKPKAGFER